MLQADAAASRGPFICKEEPIENQRPLKVRVIGAGFSGVYLGIRIPQRLRNIDLKIYEKNEGVGGTWWENRYPGCACDIPGEFDHASRLGRLVLMMFQHTRTNSASSRTRTGPAFTHLQRRSATTSKVWP